MSRELKQTKDYFLFIDKGAKIKGKEYNYCHNTGFIFQGYEESNDDDKYTNSNWEKPSRIIAYYPLTEEAKELDLPWLPNPFEEVDEFEQFRVNSMLYNDTVIELSIEITEDSPYKTGELYERELFKRLKEKGYKAAQSKQFSLEDVIELVMELTSTPSYVSRESATRIVQDYSQKLSTQQLPKEFMPEELDGDDAIVSLAIRNHCFKIKTNSEGKQELVGTYKY